MIVDLLHHLVLLTRLLLALTLLTKWYACIASVQPQILIEKESHLQQSKGQREEKA